MGVLKYHGGKSYLAKKIIEFMPEHTHYVEPYFGGGAVLFAKDPEGVSEVVNDLDGDLMNFWSVIKSKSDMEQLRLRAELTPFAHTTFDDCHHSTHVEDDIDRALRIFVRCRQSRQGLMKDFATMSKTRTRRGMNEQVSQWLGAIEGMEDAHQRLQRVVIMRGPATLVIKQQDSKDTLFYLDPPYIHSERVATDSYQFEMSDQKHKDLLDTLSGIKGKFVLSGYDSELYRSYEAENDWKRAEFSIDNKASGAKTKPKMTEVIWMNY